jgi:RNA polymerase sigma factor (sigma-70 family)
MSNRETEIGGGLRHFPSTAWTSIGDVRNADPTERRARLERLAAQYWKPVYCVIRSGWGKSNEDAKDLTQEFFVRAVLEGSLLDGFDADRGSFRTYLKGALSHFMLNAGRDASTQKRGGDASIVSLDAEEVELSALLPDEKNLPPDRMFDATWKNAVLGQALRRLEERLVAQGDPKCFRIFQRYEFESGPDAPSYQVVADELGLTPDVVKHALSKAREEFRHSVAEILCGYAGTSDILARELRDLFGS